MNQSEANVFRQERNRAASSLSDFFERVQGCLNRNSHKSPLKEMTRLEIVAQLKEECHELEIALARYHGARCRDTPEELLRQLLKDAEREAQDVAVCALMADVWLKKQTRKP